MGLVLALGFLMLSPQTVSSQGFPVQPEHGYHNEKLVHFFQAPNFAPAFKAALKKGFDDKVLPKPYFHARKATVQDLLPEDQFLLRPISSRGLLLCESPQSVMSLARRQWDGISEADAIKEIAEANGKERYPPCRYVDSLTLRDMHYELRTASDTSLRRPSWVFRWIDQFGQLQYATRPAGPEVFE